MDVVTQAISSNKHFELCPKQLPLVPPLTSLLRVHLRCEMTQLDLQRLSSLGSVLRCAWPLTHRFPVLPSLPPFGFLTHIIINTLLFFLCACPEPSSRHWGMPVGAVVQQSEAPRFGLTPLSHDRRVENHINWEVLCSESFGNSKLQAIFWNISAADQ